MDVKYQLAYRHGNGQIEGFTGCGSTKATARRDAVRKAENKANKWTPTPFRVDQVIESYTGLTSAEAAQLKSDWKISAEGRDA